MDRGMTVAVDITTDSLPEDLAEEYGAGEARDGTVERGITVSVDIITTSLPDIDADAGRGGIDNGTTVIALVMTTKD